MLNETSISILDKIILILISKIECSENIPEEEIVDLIKPAYDEEQVEYIIKKLKNYKNKTPNKRALESLIHLIEKI